MAYTRVTTENRAIAYHMREQGYSLREIGEVLGVSRERARQYLMGTTLATQGGNRRFPIHTVYPNLRVWLAHNCCNLANLIAALGLVYNPTTSNRLSRCLKGQSELRMSEIQKILEITGMTFEECFATELEEAGTE